MILKRVVVQMILDRGGPDNYEGTGPDDSSWVVQMILSLPGEMILKLPVDMILFQRIRTSLLLACLGRFLKELK